MQLAAGFLILQLAAGVLASPCTKHCHADNCLRAVRASSHFPGPSSATADCSSFMRKTVTPCPTTKTKVVQLIGTATRPVTSTQTVIVDQTLTSTLINPVTTVVSTIEYTVTNIEPTTLVVTNTIFNTVLSTIQARAVTGPATCAATTFAPSKTPAYASACSGTVRYSSACSCAGITGKTTTLPRKTVTITSFQSSQITPTSTVQITVTSTIPVIVTQNSEVPVTFQTTDATVVISSVITQTTSIQVTTTVAVQPPCASPAYNLVAYSGPYSGNALFANPPSANSGFSRIFFVELASASTFAVDSDNNMVYTSNLYGWGSTGLGDAIIDLQPGQSTIYNGQRSITPVTCSIVPESIPSLPNAVGSLSCSFDGPPVDLATYGDDASGLGTTAAETYILTPGTEDDSFTILNLAAVPAGCFT